MRALVDFCLIPIGSEKSLSPYIAACQVELAKFPVSIELHAYGTLVEGDWDDVMTAVKACHDKVHSMGVDRISTTLKIGTRTDKAQSMQEKVSSVEKLLNTES